MKSSTTPGLTPPSTLSKAAGSLWRTLVIEFAINDPPGRLLVASALESWDRVQQAQAAIKKAGLTTKDRYGCTRAHPLLAVERAARSQMLAALKALRLDIELDHPGPGRPPRQS